MLLTASPALAHGKGENENKGRGNNKVTLDASTSAQITNIKQQINDLNKQLAELKKNSRPSGRTIESDDDDLGKGLKGGVNNPNFCSWFVKQHRHWKWHHGKHFGWYGRWEMDQNLPAKCRGNATSTPPVVDTTAPTISALAVGTISTTSANVTWTTNEGATSKIFLSTTSPVSTAGTPAWTDGATTTSHGVQLNGLIPGTTYYFIVTATDAASNTATSAQGSFATQSLGGDTVAPIISSISVSGLGATGATVNWTTNESATSKLFVSTNPSVSTSSANWTDASLQTSHAAPLTGLATGTTYYFVIQATDAATNSSYSATGSFVTTAPDAVAPIISSLSAAPTGSTTASVTWTTNESSDSTVYYSTTSPVTTASPYFVTNGSLVTSHATSLTGLSASTTYYVIIGSKDAANNLATSSQTSFTTSN
jgi:hypothetical protein